MRHYIIVKFSDRRDRERLLGEIRTLFERSLEIPGVKDLRVVPGCSERENRYDLMISMNMTEDGLKAYDVSEMHHYWKEHYGHLIEKKTIFDSDED